MTRSVVVTTAVLMSLFLAACNPENGNGDSASETDDDTQSPSQASLDEGIAETVTLNFFESLGFFSSEYFHDARVAALTRSEQDVVPPVPSDYLQSTTTESGNINVNYSVDGEGNILPSAQWRKNNSAYCRDQGKFMRAPEWRFQIAMFPDTNELALRLIDIETSKIEAQRMGQGDGDFWVDEAINNAWNPTEFPQLQQAASPCGDDIEMTLVMKSDIEILGSGSEGGTLERRSVVETEVGLGFSAQGDELKGSETLPVTKAGIILPEAGESVTCTEVAHSGMISVTVELPDGSLSYDPRIAMHLEIEEMPSVTFSCTITTEQGTSTIPVDDMAWLPWFTFMHEDDHLESDASFRFEGWNESEDEPSLLAELAWDRTDSTEEDSDGNKVDVFEDTSLQLIIGSQP